MKKYLLLLTALAAFAATHAQSDDVYFVPKKQAKPAKEVYYIGSDRDVDEYNRHGALYSSVDSLGDDVVADFDAAIGEYPDSLASDAAVFEDMDDDSDFRYSRRISRWECDSCLCCDDADEWLYCNRICGWPYYGAWGGWYSPWYYGWGWYDPWYYGYWGWYNPWYYSYWGGWYGWRGGWYAGLGHVRNYSNRGRGHMASAGVGGATGRRGTRNVYNDIAKRSNTTRRAAGARGVTTTRSTGVNSSTRNSYNSTRSYAPSRSTTTTRSSGSGFGGSRGGFGGGFGGGARGGGGGHGGRR